MSPDQRAAIVRKREPSIGANLTRIRATLEAAERQLGFPLGEGFAALNRLERQIRKLKEAARAK